MSFHSQEHQEMQSFNPTLLYIAPKIHGDAFKIIDFAKKNIEILASLLKYVYFLQSSHNPFYGGAMSYREYKACNILNRFNFLISISYEKKIF